MPAPRVAEAPGRIARHTGLLSAGLFPGALLPGALLLGLIGALVQLSGENRAQGLWAARERAAIAALRDAARAGGPPEAVPEARLAALRAAEVARLRRDERVFWLAVASGNLLLLILLGGAALALDALADRRRDMQALRRVQDSALAAEQARARLLAAASHDLRQPLQAVRLFAGALERRITDPDTAPLVEGLRTATAGMTRMFNALLDIARLDAGAVTPAPVEFPFSDILEGLRTEFAALAAAKGLRFVAEADPVVLHTDPALLESVIRNLLSNAVKYTASGEVALRCRAEGHSLGARALIEVADTGPGIPPEETGTIFQEFRRLPGAGAAADGLGLGLAIVRRLADLLGLRLGVESAPGAGSRFFVEVPIRHTVVVAPRKLPPPPRPGAAPEEAWPTLAGRQILLVDDDALLRQGLEATLRSVGLRVLAAADDRAACVLFERPDPPVPDFVLVDHDLGRGVTGIALLDRLAARFGVAAPAMVITGATEPEVLQDLRDSGYPWLAKPVTTATLLDGIARAMAGRAAEAETQVP